MRNANAHALTLGLAVLALTLAGCGGDSASSGVVGSYSMDAGAFLKGMEETILKDAPKEMRDMMLPGLKAARVDLVVKADGTYVVNRDMQDEKSVHKGTWSQEGNALLFLETEVDGETQESPLEIKGTLKDGDILLKPDPSMPFSIVMQKN